MGLQIRLFGEFSIRRADGSELRLDSARAGSLLAYLILNRDAAGSRERIAYRLWPDSAEPQARTNLRHVLHRLRRRIADLDQYVESTRDLLRWRSDASAWVDVVAFEAALARDDLAGLRTAVDLYSGDLLDGSYDEWLVSERDRLRRLYQDALRRLSAGLEDLGDRVGAIAAAERSLAADPLDEATYRRLIRLYDANGDRARAMRTYHACVAVLDAELGIEPSTQTRQTYDALLPTRVDSATPSPSGPPDAGVPAGTPLVGRAPERARLAALWRATEAGRAQLVTVTGEAGIGKSRLVEAFRSWCARQGALTATARAYAAEGMLTYGPIVGWLRSKALASRIRRLDRIHLVELARLLPELEDEMPGLRGPGPPPAGELRQRLFDAVVAAVGNDRRPLLLVAEDVQWWDQDSLQLVHYLLRDAPSASLLVAATCRPEDVDDQHPFTAVTGGLLHLDQSAEIALDRLTRSDTATLVERLTRQVPAPEAVDALHEDTEGNPLFVVEAVRAGWAGASDATRPLTPKVTAVIAARLANLSGPTTRLVRMAATIGREFTADVLGVAADVDRDTLLTGLDELWRRRIVREQGTDAYDFSHDKIREVAYRAMSPAEAADAHRQVARALGQVYAGRLDQISSRLAAHHERSGAAAEAITAYVRAAATAQRQYANTEAVRLLRRAEALVGLLPDSADRQRTELDLVVASLHPIGAVEGWGSDALAAANQRALGLTRALGADPAPPVLRAMALAALSRGDFDTGRRCGEQLRELGERAADDVILVESDYILGIAHFWQADFHAARHHFEAAVARYQPAHRATHLARYLIDPQVVCLSRLANTWWFLGKPERAAQVRDQALVLAEEIDHPASRDVALVFAALLAVDMGESDRVRDYAATLSEGLERRWRPVQVSAAVYAGFVDVLDGDVTGVRRIQQVLADSAQSGQHAPGSDAANVRVLLAACVVADDAETGRATADRLLAMGGPARLWEAEALRRRAEFAAVVEPETAVERSGNARSGC